MYRYLLTCFAIVLVLGAGYVHGTITQRWQPSEYLTQAASRLKALPTSVGDWLAKAVDRAREPDAT